MAGGVLLGLLCGRAGAADRPQVLLYASDWLGPMRVLAADPIGGHGLGQLTFQRVERANCGLPWACGTEDPAPSPDGRVLAYTESGELWFARPDGSHPYRVARTRVEALAWSRDSRRLAYTTADGLHVVGPTGREHRRVPRFRASELAWSLDSRAIAGRDGSRISVLRGNRTTLVATNAGIGAPSLAWLPNGRISFTTGPLWSDTNVVTVSATGLGTVRDLGPGSGPAWTPDGRLVAVSTSNGIEVIDPATGGRRRLTRESGFELEWSPDGRTLAYIQGWVPRSATPRAPVTCGRSRSRVACVRSSRRTAGTADRSSRSPGRDPLPERAIAPLPTTTASSQADLCRPSQRTGSVSHTAHAGTCTPGHRPQRRPSRSTRRPAVPATRP